MSVGFVSFKTMKMVDGCLVGETSKGEQVVLSRMAAEDVSKANETLKAEGANDAAENLQQVPSTDQWP